MSVIYTMTPTKEYLDHIKKRLEAMNPHLPANSNNEFSGGFELPNTMDQMGRAAIEYLKNKKDPEILPDPLFPNRN
jgi:hypothetical protein